MSDGQYLSRRSRRRRAVAAVASLVVLALVAAVVTRASQVAGPSSEQAARPSGEADYMKYCAACHDQGGARIPGREALAKLSPARILRILDFGVMMSVAYPMRRDQREAVANFIGTGSDDVEPPRGAFCTADNAVMAGSPRGNWAGWGPTPANTQFQSADAARLAVEDVGRLELKWAYAFPGDVIAFAASTVVNGTVFVGSAGGGVQALDAKTGCIHWRYQADGPVRAAMTAAADAAETTLVFGDQNGMVYDLDARTGQLRWKKKVEEHEATRLTGSVAVHDGVAFVPAASWEETRATDPTYPCCTFRGSVTAVRVRDGSIAWKTYLVDPPRKTGTTTVGTDTFGPSGAGVWGAPTVDAARGLLYIATGDNYSHPATATSDAIVALDLKTGRIVWSEQAEANDVYNSSCGNSNPNCPPGNGPDHDFGAPVMLVRAPNGRDILVAGQKSALVYGLDPANQGKILWQTRVGKGGPTGGIQWGLASDARNVYVSVADAVRVRGRGGSAPIGDAQFEPAQGGGLTALDVLTGAKVWFAQPAPCDPPRPGCSPAQPGAVTAIPGAVFSGSMDGHIRAFSTVDGKVIWDFNTEQTYHTVNGVPGTGGSLDGTGPVVAGGMVFVNSGYPRFGGASGNVLLAFGIRESGQ